MKINRRSVLQMVASLFAMLGFGNQKGYSHPAMERGVYISSITKEWIGGKIIETVRFSDGKVICGQQAKEDSERLSIPANAWKQRSLYSWQSSEN